MPRTHRFTLGLTLLNLVLLALLVSSQARSALAGQSGPGVLRGRALEIVDDQGRVRAEILVHGPETIPPSVSPTVSRGTGAFNYMPAIRPAS